MKVIRMQSLPCAQRRQDPLREKTVAEKVLLDGKFLKIYRQDVQLPNGKMGFRDLIRHPGAAGMLPLYEDGTILLERQWRHPVGQSFWEIPAGKLDPDEEMITCAKRELEEECGVVAHRWTWMGDIHNAIGYSNEKLSIFLAEDLERGVCHWDDGEFLEVYRVPVLEAKAMTEDGRITDVKTIIAIQWLCSKYCDRWEKFPEDM